MLDDGFDMPPLMLTPDEVEAAVLGAQLVARQGDLALARAAEDLVAKIRTVVPERLRPLVLEPSSRVAPNWRIVPDSLDMGAVRLSIRAGHKIRMSYRDEQERRTDRTVWPFAVGYHESVRLMIAWCELRQDFRSFRTDRVDEAEFLEERYPERPAMLRARWRRQMAEMAERMGMREARSRSAGRASPLISIS